MSTGERFENGTLFIAGKEIDVAAMPWVAHGKFTGVALKHLITARDTGGAFSYHLVQILPQKKIGLHMHETQLETHEVVGGAGVCRVAGQKLAYGVGHVAVLPAGVEHEVLAGKKGLFLLAKFMPSLC